MGEEYIRTHFKVKDTGIGMSEEFQKKIFDTFSREEENEKVQKITGTGLGMSITKSIIDLMGGTIELKSEQGKGSQFHVILDFKKADIGENEMKLPEWNVLVVDDNPFITQLNIGLYKAVQHCITPTKKGRLILCRTVCFYNGCCGYYTRKGWYTNFVLCNGE